MAAPHIIPMSKVSFNSIMRTVENLTPPSPVIDVYNNTAQFPMSMSAPPLAGAIRQPLAFTTRLNPSGSAAGAKTPPDGVLMKACCLKESISTTVSTTYTSMGNLVTDFTAADIDVAVGNALLFGADDCAGDLTMRAVAGQPILCDWALNGVYTTIAEGAITAAVGNGGAAPLCVNNTTTINNDAVVLRSWTLALNNIIDIRPDIVAATGYQPPLVIRQTPTLDMLIECPATATANYYTDLTTAGNTLQTFSTVLGSGAGYVITITGKFYLAAAPATQQLGAGIMGLRLVYQMDWASGSPLAIAFT